MADVRHLIDVQTNEAKPGFRIGDRYVLTRAIKTAGFGELYLADDTAAAQQVLLALHRAPWSANPDRTDLFETRARALEALEHANLAGVLDHGVADGRCYAIMERFDGERLVDKLARKRRMSIEEMLPIVSQLLKALEYVHARGIVARCVDPSHILLCSDGFHANIVRLVGFGIGELLQNCEPPDDKELVGSPGYAAPEQLAGGDVDARADVYAMGRLMIALLQGETTPVDVPLSQRGSTNGFHVPPGSNALPEPLLRLMKACLHPSPQDRPAHGAALVEQLIDAVPSASMLRLPRITGSHVAVGRRSPSGQTPAVESAQASSTAIPVDPPAPTPVTATPPARRSVLVPMLGGVALCALAIGVVYSQWPDFPAETPLEAPNAELSPAAEVEAPSEKAAAPPTRQPLEVGEPDRSELLAGDHASDSPGSEHNAAARAEPAAPQPELPATVRIDSRPRGALFIDGAERGETPFEGELAPGVHYIEVVGRGGQRWRETLEVDAGSNESLILKAPPAAANQRAAKKKKKKTNSKPAPPQPTAAEPRPAAPEPTKDDPFLRPSKRKENKESHLLPGGSGQ